MMVCAAADVIVDNLVSVGNRRPRTTKPKPVAKPVIQRSTNAYRADDDDLDDDGDPLEPDSKRVRHARGDLE